ncbi:hypothetical protein ACQY0O_005670 [Thecaphora frezii]
MSSFSTLFLTSLSRLLGWTYTFLWSLSFYPQLLTNHRRGSTSGLSSDYVLLNFLGHTCYALYNLSFLLSSEVRREYLERYGKQNVVQWNDGAFSVHASVISGLTVVQWLVIRRRQRLHTQTDGEEGGEAEGGQETTTSRTLNYTLVILLTAILAGIGLWNIGAIPVLEIVNVLAYVKLGVTLVKYWPQIWLNAQRKSTKGFSVENVVLDAGGGVLSLAQLALDTKLVGGGWRDLRGMVGKLGLSLLSLAYDGVLIAQHYCIYPNGPASSSSDSSSSNTITGGDEETEPAQQRSTGATKRDAGLAGWWRGETRRGTERQRLLDPSDDQDAGETA